MDSQEPTRTDLQLAANRVGRLLTQVGDFYDVAEELARGYAAASASYPPSGGSSPSVERSAKHRYIELQIGALNELSSVCQNIIEWRVDDAREAGMTWQNIADVLEISRQAAHTRFTKVRDITDYPPL